MVLTFVIHLIQSDVCLITMMIKIPFGNLIFFAKGIAHEYAHCFVNPTIEAHKYILKNLDTFFKNHKNMPNAYNVDYAVMNEYWVRAFTIRFMEQNQNIFPDFDITAEYQRQKESFIYIEKFVNLLKHFEQSELLFEDFYPDVMRNFQH